MAIDPIPSFGKLAPSTSNTGTAWGRLVLTISNAFRQVSVWVVDFAAAVVAHFRDFVGAAVDLYKAIRRANHDAQLKLLSRFQLKLSREPVRIVRMVSQKPRRVGRAASLSSAWRLAA